MTDQPTPNSMPGAEAETASEAKVDAAQAAKTAAASTNAIQQDVLGGDDAAELARLRKIHADESKWEKRAKQNFDDAQRFRELAEQLGGKESKEFDPKAAIDALRRDVETERTERLRADVARTTHVDPAFIIGSTEEDMRASADRYLADVQQRIEEALKAKNVPAAPPASTVTSNGKISGPEQITSREELKKLPPAELAKAYEEGRLDSLMGKTPS